MRSASPALLFASVSGTNRTCTPVCCSNRLINGVTYGSSTLEYSTTSRGGSPLPQLSAHRIKRHVTSNLIFACSCDACVASFVRGAKEATQASRLQERQLLIIA